MGIDGINSDLTTVAAVASAAKDSNDVNSFAKTLEGATKSNNTNSKKDSKLYEACQGLESVFLAQVLDAMRATIPKSDLLSSGFADDTFESMLYDQFAQKMSQTDSTGLADEMYKQLEQQANPSTSATVSDTTSKATSSSNTDK